VTVAEPGAVALLPVVDCEPLGCRVG
jgi:hypothetical protein